MSNAQLKSPLLDIFVAIRILSTSAILHITIPVQLTDPALQLPLPSGL